MSTTNKSLFFLSGFALGLISGVVFFYLWINNIQEKKNISDSFKDTIANQNKTIDSLKKQKTEAEINKVVGNKDSFQKTMNSAALLEKKYSKEVPARKVMTEAYSLLKDTFSTMGQDDFIVRKDEMLEVRNFAVTNLKETGPANTGDSLLEKVSGIKDEEKGVIASFKVEFWQSPINYKGYKMTKNKIVLFGISPDETIKIYNKEDVIFVKQNQNYFKLYYTDDFQQLEKVTDASVISMFK